MHTQINKIVGSIYLSKGGSFLLSAIVCIISKLDSTFPNELCCDGKKKKGAFQLKENSYLCFDESREPVAGRQKREA